MVEHYQGKEESSWLYFEVFDGWSHLICAHNIHILNSLVCWRAHSLPCLFDQHKPGTFQLPMWNISAIRLMKIIASTLLFPLYSDLLLRSFFWEVLRRKLTPPLKLQSAYFICWDWLLYAPELTCSSCRQLMKISGTVMIRRITHITRVHCRTSSTCFSLKFHLQWLTSDHGYLKSQ